MSGTVDGGRKAAVTNKLEYGNDFFTIIGRKGGFVSHGGGFASDKIGPDGLTGRQRASTAGIKGGQASRRGPNRDYEERVEAAIAIPSRFDKLKNYLAGKN